MSSSQKIAKNTIYLYLRLFVVMLISLYTVRVLMSELGIDGFGIFNVVAGFVTMLGFIGTTMSTGIQRFFNYEMGKNGEKSAIEVYSAALKIQLVCAIFILVAFETIGLWYVNNVMNLPEERINEVNWLYQFAIGSLIVNVLVVPFNAFAISKEHMDFYAILSSIEAIGKLGIVFTLTYFATYKLAAYGFLLLILALINFLGYYIFCRIKYPWLKFAHKTDRNLVRPILQFSGWNAVSAMSNLGKGQGVSLLLNYFFGVTVNAANAIVTQIYSAVQLFSINICTAFRPQLTERYAKGEMDKTKAMFFLMSKVTYVMVFTICVPLCLKLNYVLNVWLGDNIPEFTNEFTILTLLTVLIGAMNTPISLVIYANGNIRDYILTYSSICLCLPLGWFAFKFGAPAVFVFGIIAFLMCIIQILSLILLKRAIVYSICNYIKEVLLPIVYLSILMPMLPLCYTYFNRNNTFISFVIVIVLSGLSALASFYFIMLNRLQRAYINNVVFKIINRIKRYYIFDNLIV